MKIPSATSAARIVIKELEYNNGRLDVEFGHRVQWKKPQVSVKDSGGRTYPARIADRDGDDCEIRVSGLKRGRKYTVRITGIKETGRREIYVCGQEFLCEIIYRYLSKEPPVLRRRLFALLQRCAVSR